MGFLLPAAIVIVLDQVTKQLIWRNGQNYEIIGDYFRITLVKNAGAAFGLFQGGRFFFIAASVIAVGFIIYVGWRLPRVERFRRFLLGIILGGAIGNLIDRVYAGEVIDFLDIGFGVHRWPVFNVADMGVSVGATILLIFLLRSPGGNEPVAGADGVVVDSGDGDPPPTQVD